MPHGALMPTSRHALSLLIVALLMSQSLACEKTTPQQPLADLGASTSAPDQATIKKETPPETVAQALDAVVKHCKLDEKHIPSSCTSGENKRLQKMVARQRMDALPDLLSALESEDLPTRQVAAHAFKAYVPYFLNDAAKLDYTIRGDDKRVAPIDPELSKRIITMASKFEPDTDHELAFILDSAIDMATLASLDQEARDLLKRFEPAKNAEACLRYVTLQSSEVQPHRGFVGRRVELLQGAAHLIVHPFLGGEPHYRGCYGERIGAHCGVLLLHEGQQRAHIALGDELWICGVDDGGDVVAQDLSAEALLAHLRGEHQLCHRADDIHALASHIILEDFVLAVLTIFDAVGVAQFAALEHGIEHRVSLGDFGFYGRFDDRFVVLEFRGWGFLFTPRASECGQGRQQGQRSKSAKQ